MEFNYEEGGFLPTGSIVKDIEVRLMTLDDVLYRTILDALTALYMLLASML